ncbi:MAG TPA: hypothetical protein VGM81_22290 [Burkholderiaceae bacterium]|jgi:hypothetical protein
MNKQTKAPAKAAASKAPISANFKFERAAAAMESASGSPRPRADRRAPPPSKSSDADVLSGANAFFGLLDTVHAMEEADWKPFESAEAPVEDPCNYATISEAIKNDLVRNLFSGTSASREGYLRAMTAILVPHASSNEPAAERAEAAILTTARSFSAQQIHLMKRSTQAASVTASAVRDDLKANAPATDYLGHSCQTTEAFTLFEESVENARQTARKDRRAVARGIGVALNDISRRIEHQTYAGEAVLKLLPNDGSTDEARAVLMLAEPYGLMLSNKFFELAGLALVALELGGLLDIKHLESPRAEQALDLEDAGHRLQGFAALVGWIERARALTDELKAAARNNPKLHDLLSSHGLAYGDAYWDDDESNGLRRLMTEMWTAADAIRKVGRP